MNPRVLLIYSLAKGFGVPLAVLSGSTRMIQRFVNQSETRMHCSPPAIATLSAAEHALSLNASRGDALRFHLAKLRPLPVSPQVEKRNLNRERPRRT